MHSNEAHQFIEQAWQRGLDVLGPTPLELERGLALHRALSVCDNYGFLPSVPTGQVSEFSNALLDRGAGIAEWKQKSWACRVTAPASNEEAAGEYFDALDHAGVCGTVQNISDIGESLEYAVMNIAAHRHLCNVFKERFFQATCAEDLESARATGRIGVLFSLTGLPIAGAGSMADPDALLDWLDVWYHMGIRFMHISYNRRNYFGEGCTELRDGGLSDFGAELIARMNKAGIIVDLPHSSFGTTCDAASISRKPVIATHAGCRAVHDHPRCKSDEELKAIAASGGYIGIFAEPSLLGPNADLNLLLKHVQHAVETVGAEHVAIGTDIAYRRNAPAGVRPHPGASAHILKVSGFRPEHLQHASRDHLGGSLTWTNWPLITVGLLRMGLRETEIEKILGGNLRRTLRACRPEGELEASRAARIRGRPESKQRYPEKSARNAPEPDANC